MSTELEPSPETSSEPDEKQLCLSCLAPNDPSANFCLKCRAPLSSYAATGPFEHLFAEGYAYRQAVDRPHRFIVVLGIWLLFGAMALIGLMLMAMGLHNHFFAEVIMGLATVVASTVMIAKTTRNYLAIKQGAEKIDRAVVPH